MTLISGARVAPYAGTRREVVDGHTLREGRTRVGGYARVDALTLDARLTNWTVAVVQTLGGRRRGLRGVTPDEGVPNEAREAAAQWTVIGGVTLYAFTAARVHYAAHAFALVAIAELVIVTV